MFAGSQPADQGKQLRACEAASGVPRPVLGDLFLYGKGNLRDQVQWRDLRVAGVRSTQGLRRCCSNLVCSACRKEYFFSVCDHLKELEEKYSQASLRSAQTRDNHHQFLWEKLAGYKEKIVPHERD